MHKHIIQKVQPNSIAEELDLEPGDILLSINGNDITDVFDYHFMINEEYLEVIIQKANGEEWELEIEKDIDEDLGLIFDESLMDHYRSCRNQCIFCFIDQMPKGMRETLYFKDDDSRLSFLQGNYVTLTNMSDEDISRIIRYHLEPINISFHTTNPELRCKMLHNRFAGEALKKVHTLYEGHIHMNGQIVLCKGVNDGAELERSLQDMAAYYPYLQSVSIVPVGISKYREGLADLAPFTREDAKQVLSTIHSYQCKMLELYQDHVFYAGDEWYILAGEEIPSYNSYDDFKQLENGVGMLRLLIDEVTLELESHVGDQRSTHCTLITGKLAAPHIEELVQMIRLKYPHVRADVRSIQNDFFGELITVSGLITGQDIQKQLQGVELGSRVLIPTNMLRAEQDLFLDDMSVEELSLALQVPITIVKSSGSDFVKSVVQKEG